MNTAILNYINYNKEVEFKPHHTAIGGTCSNTAKLLLGEVDIKDFILDYGCGLGRNMQYLADNTGKKIHGTDIIEQLNKEKNRHDQLRKAGHTIELSHLLSDNYYDKVLCSHVLNVVDNDNVKQSILNDICTKLKRGGKLYLEVRTEKDITKATSKEKYNDGWKIKKGKYFTYQEGITKEKMCNLIQQAGLTIEKHIFNSSKHIVIASK